jgi:hypothetical protein
MPDKEKMVKIYDPFRDAFCQVPISQAKKLVEQVEKIKAAIEKAEAN